MGSEPATQDHLDDTALYLLIAEMLKTISNFEVFALRNIEEFDKAYKLSGSLLLVSESKVQPRA